MRKNTWRRRDFLGTAAAAGGAMVAPGWLTAAMGDAGATGERDARAAVAEARHAESGAAEVNARVAQIVAKTIGVDMHNHVYPAGTEPRFPNQAAPAPQTGAELSIAEEIHASGLTAVCASYVLDFAKNEKPGDARENFLNWLTAVDGQLERGHIRRALKLQDLESAHRNGQATIVQSVEGSHFIEGHLERVGEVHQRGVRHLQLLHERDDMVKPLGDTNTAAAHLGGLTAFGAEVVRECNRLGILVDMAHASNETVLGVVKVSKAPFLVSHTSLDTFTGGNLKMAEMMKPRLISKEHAKVVADAGGVVGVWTHLAGSLQEFVQSVKAMVDAIGIEHVGVGSDTDLLSMKVGQGTNKAWEGLTGGFFNAVVGEMLRQGFSEEEIEKVGGGNYCRVFGRAVG